MGLFCKRALQKRPIISKETCNNTVYKVFHRIWYTTLVDTEMSTRVVSRSMPNFGTCQNNAAAQCQLPTNFAAKYVFQSEEATPQWHFF